MRGRRGSKKELKYRSEVGYGQDEFEALEMARMAGREDEIKSLKAEMNGKRFRLLSAFNQLSQERRLQNDAPMPILHKSIVEYTDYYGCIGYPLDLFVQAIQQIDISYIERRCEELRRKNKHG